MWFICAGFYCILQSLKKKHIVADHQERPGAAFRAIVIFIIVNVV